MHYIGIAFVLGGLSFAHCLGMCGGFCLHLSKGPRCSLVLLRQLLWHAGKTTTYVFLGALAGFLGLRIGSAGLIPGIQNLATYIAGAIMILMGLTLGGWVPIASRENESLLTSVVGQFVRQPTPGAAFVLGLVTGFLPCPIVWTALALAFDSGSVPLAMITMTALGVGTLWSLLLLGLTGSMLQQRFRRGSNRVGAAFLIVLGLATLARGTEFFHRVLGCPRDPHAIAAPADHSRHPPPATTVPTEDPPCCGRHEPRADSRENPRP